MRDVLLNSVSGWIESDLLWPIVRGCRSSYRRDESWRAIQVIETVLHDPGMDMTPKAGQVRLFSDNNNTIRLFDRRHNRLSIKWYQCAQIDDLNSAIRALDGIGCRGTGLQHHRAPGDDCQLARSIPDAQATGFPDGQGIVAIGNHPVFLHRSDKIACTILRRFRAIQASPLKKGYRRFRTGCFQQESLGVEGGSRADGHHAWNVGEPLLTGIRVTKCATARAAAGDWSAAAAARLSTNDQRHAP